MIHFHPTSRHQWTVRAFLRYRAPHLAEQIHVTPYDAIDVSKPIPPGVHIFSDLERLLKHELTAVRELHDRLAARPESYRTINNPSEWVGRFDLLDLLAARGYNDFRAHRVNDLDDVKYPAFLRWDNDHAGSVGDPVHSRAELDRVVSSAVGWKRAPLKRHLMVTEKVDVSDAAGLHRKYSAMMIGDHLVPRHVMFTTDWVTKFPDVVGPQQIHEEQAFLDEFPDQERLRDVFALSGLTYGRVDYGYLNGRMQVWEINTNPVVVLRPGKLAKARRPGQRQSADAVIRAFEALLAESPTQPSDPLFGRRERLIWPAKAALMRGYDRFRR